MKKKDKLILRLANISDSKLLFNWLNEKEVRNNSLKSEIVKWDIHSDWFCKKLESAKCKIFILENNKDSLGQVRIEEDETGSWLIDYSIDSAFRSKGHGSVIIEQLINKNTGLSFKAVVKMENEASKRVFEKLNFVSKQMENVIEYRLG